MAEIPYKTTILTFNKGKWSREGDSIQVQKFIIYDDEKNEKVSSQKKSWKKYENMEGEFVEIKRRDSYENGPVIKHVDVDGSESEESDVDLETDRDIENYVNGHEGPAHMPAPADPRQAKIKPIDNKQTPYNEDQFWRDIAMIQWKNADEPFDMNMALGRIRRVKTDDFMRLFFTLREPLIQKITTKAEGSMSPNEIKLVASHFIALGREHYIGTIADDSIDIEQAFLGAGLCRDFEEKIMH